MFNGVQESSLIERELAEGAPLTAETSQSWEGESELPEPSRFREIEIKKVPRIWAVGGGKGGVGKSLISASFALHLARRGRSVVAVDLDLGGANLHTCLGLEPGTRGLGDWIAGRETELDALLVQGPNSHLKVLSGSQDPLGVTSMGKERVSTLLKTIRTLDADEVIIDLGAGTHESTVMFFSAADRGILSVLPEPTSVENVYRFIRAFVFQRFRELDLPPAMREVVEASADPKNMLGVKTPGDLLAIVDRLDPEQGQRLRAALMNLDLNLVVNQVRTAVDVDVGRAICSVCRRYFGIDLKYPGYLDYDNAVWKAVRARRPVIDEFPQSILASRVDRLARTLLGEEKGLFP